MAVDDEGLGIPAEYLPEHPDQIPAWALDRKRFLVCFAITRAICQRDDPVFLGELYSSPMPTGDLDFKAPTAES